jgi:hypothetical protein
VSQPFRTGLISASGSAHSVDPEGVSERVEDTIAEARGATVIDARMRGWINHGDEQVPLALIEGALGRVVAQSEVWSLHLYARAVRDAERDGVCWTPLLDRMAVAGVWPTQKGRVVLGGRQLLPKGRILAREALDRRQDGEA